MGNTNTALSFFFKKFLQKYFFEIYHFLADNLKQISDVLQI